VTAWWCEHAVLPEGAASGVSVMVEGDRIVAVDADTAPPPNATRLTGVTIAGLANSHSHAFHRALRSRTQAGTGSFWTWREVMYEAATRLDPETYHRLARGVYAEMAMAGHTVVGEFHYLHHQADGTPYRDPNAMGEALLAAAADVGIRITLLDTLYLHGGLAGDGYLAVEGAQVRFRDRDVDAWANRVSAVPAGPDQQVGAAIHSVRAVDPDAIAEAACWAREHAAPLHAHVSEQTAENDACLARHGCTPTELLENGGALGTDFCAVHATHLTAHDIGLLAGSASTVCLCPTTERDLGDGIGPTVELSNAGVGLHLGSDSHASIDHFVEARSVEWGERLRTRRRGAHAANDLLAMATVNGHRALGWHDAGRIAVGERADLVTVRLDSERTAGTPPGLAAGVVFAATAADVVSVVSGGRRIVADGRHDTIDAAAELSASIEEVLA
jgi:formiminoglutamate deiminase